VIRRFEIYGLGPAAPGSRVDGPRVDGPGVRALETACRRCGEFIPEVLHSRVGRANSDGMARLIWEHAFVSPETYCRYMVHPFHADVLDRYILNDSPERVVVDDSLCAGLVGYFCDGPLFDLSRGVRRLVLLRLDRNATPVEIDRLIRTLTDGPVDDDRMILSVVGANTLGAAWFDAVTPITGRPRWTHIWEQGFSDRDGLDAYRDGASPLAEAERRGFSGWHDGIIEGAASLHYAVDEPAS
jgi:hypothetical protein